MLSILFSLLSSSLLHLLSLSFSLLHLPFLLPSTSLSPPLFPTSHFYSLHSPPSKSTTLLPSLLPTYPRTLHFLSSLLHLQFLLLSTPILLPLHLPPLLLPFSSSLLPHLLLPPPLSTSSLLRLPPFIFTLRDPLHISPTPPVTVVLDLQLF